MGLPQTQTFSYDPLDRLLSASASGGFNGVGDYSQGYSYDPLSGNLAAKGGVSYSYGDSSHAHAVTSLSNGSSFQYDANGNMTQRTVNGQTYHLSYDAENRLAGVSGASTASFTYNGDGERVVSTVGGAVVVYVGEYFEWQPATTALTKYYYAGSQRIAIRVGEDAPLWLLGDHLGSTSVVANTDATQHSRKGYKAFGESRFTVGSLPTRYQFTGQASHEADFGLYFYKARWCDPALSRWSQPDTVVPSPENPLDWDRYSYTRNNPLKYTDPDGHFPWLVLIGVLVYMATLPGDTGPYDVNPTTAAIGEAGLRMADPVDWAYTGIECLSGNCSATDILFGMLPFVNGGLDDATDAARTLQRAQSAGKWIQRSEFMSDAAREYQRFISGRADDLVYEIGGYTFDGFDASLGILKDAKDIPINFIDAATNQFKPWVSGTNSWLRQAQNQVNAAEGLKIQWLFNSQAAREAMYNLFLKENPDLLNAIDLIYKPME